MSGGDKKWSEEDLHAYIDGQMHRDRRREYEQYLATRPDLLRRIHSYQLQIGEMFRAFGSAKDWRS